MLILTFTSGVAAQGLLVFAQRTIQIGTIGIAQVAQPALAVVWSFLLLGEVLNQWQIAGIAIVVTGLLAFVMAHQRRARARGDSAQTRRPDRAGVHSIELGDEVRGGFHPPIRLLAQGLAPWRRRRSSPAMRARASSAKTSTGASSRAGRRRGSRRAAPRAPSIAASRHSPSAACSPPPAARCHAVADSSAARAGASRPSARRTRPRCTRASAAMRRSPVASAFSIASSSVAAPVS